jgi:hypothetical protein
MEVMPYMGASGGALPMVTIDPVMAARMGYSAARNVVRGVSGARKRARKRRARRRKQPPARKGERSQRGGELVTAAKTYAPVAISQTIRQTYTGLSDYKVKHMEYIGDIAGSDDFAVSKYRLNPASGLTFPWLSRIAANYEKYRFDKLKFFLKPQAPTTARGVLMLAVDYDPTDPAPALKRDVLQYDGVVRAAPWNDCAMIVKKNSEPHFIAPVQPADDADIRLSDVGNLYVCTQGQSDLAGEAVSELWVDYELTLITPQPAAPCTFASYVDEKWDGSNVFDNEDNLRGPSDLLYLNDGDLRVSQAGSYFVVASVKASELWDPSIPYTFAMHTPTDSSTIANKCSSGAVGASGQTGAYCIFAVSMNPGQALFTSSTIPAEVLAGSLTLSIIVLPIDMTIVPFDNLDAYLPEGA